MAKARRLCSFDFVFTLWIYFPKFVHRNQSGNWRQRHFKAVWVENNQEKHETTWEGLAWNWGLGPQSEKGGSLTLDSLKRRGLSVFFFYEWRNRAGDRQANWGNICNSLQWRRERQAKGQSCRSTLNPHLWSRAVDSDKKMRLQIQATKMSFVQRVCGLTRRNRVRCSGIGWDAQGLGEMLRDRVRCSGIGWDAQE